MEPPAKKTTRPRQIAMISMRMSSGRTGSPASSASMRTETTEPTSSSPRRTKGQTRSGRNSGRCAASHTCLQLTSPSSTCAHTHRFTEHTSTNRFSSEVFQLAVVGALQAPRESEAPRESGVRTKHHVTNAKQSTCAVCGGLHLHIHIHFLLLKKYLFRLRPCTKKRIMVFFSFVVEKDSLNQFMGDLYTYKQIKKIVELNNYKRKFNFP